MTMKVEGLGTTMRSFEATTSEAAALRAKLEEDARLTSCALDQRLTLLEGEVLSRGRVRAPPRPSAVASTPQVGFAASNSSGAALPASDGMAQGLTALAR